MPRSEYDSIEEWKHGIPEEWGRREGRGRRRRAPQIEPGTPPSEVPAHLRGFQARLQERAPLTPEEREALRQREQLRRQYPRLEPGPALESTAAESILRRTERETGLPAGLLRSLVQPDTTEEEAREIRERVTQGEITGLSGGIEMLMRPLDLPGAMLAGGARALGREWDRGPLRALGEAAYEASRTGHEFLWAYPGAGPPTIAEEGYRLWVPAGMEDPSLGRQAAGFLTGLAGAAASDPLLLGLPLTRHMGAVPARLVAARDIPVAAKAAARVFPRALRRDVARAITRRAREGLARAGAIVDDPIVDLLRGTRRGQDVAGEIGSGVVAGIREVAPAAPPHLMDDAMRAFSRQLRSNIEPGGWRYWGHRLRAGVREGELDPRGTARLVRRAERVAETPEDAMRIAQDILERRPAISQVEDPGAWPDVLRRHIEGIAEDYGPELASFESRALAARSRLPGVSGRLHDRAASILGERAGARYAAEVHGRRAQAAVSGGAPPPQQIHQYVGDAYSHAVQGLEDVHRPQSGALADLLADELRFWRPTETSGAAQVFPGVRGPDIARQGLYPELPGPGQATREIVEATASDIMEQVRGGVRGPEAAWRAAREAGEESGARARRHAGEVWRRWFEPDERRVALRRQAAERAAEARIPEDVRGGLVPVSAAHRAALERGMRPAGPPAAEAEGPLRGPLTDLDQPLRIAGEGPEADLEGRREVRREMRAVQQELEDTIEKRRRDWGEDPSTPRVIAGWEAERDMHRAVEEAVEGGDDPYAALDEAAEEADRRVREATTRWNREHAGEPQAPLEGAINRIARTRREIEATLDAHLGERWYRRTARPGIGPPRQEPTAGRAALEPPALEGPVGEWEERLVEPVAEEAEAPAVEVPEERPLSQEQALNAYRRASAEVDRTRRELQETGQVLREAAEQHPRRDEFEAMADDYPDRTAYTEAVVDELEAEMPEEVQAWRTAREAHRAAIERSDEAFAVYTRAQPYTPKTTGPAPPEPEGPVWERHPPQQAPISRQGRPDLPARMTAQPPADWPESVPWIPEVRAALYALEGKKGKTLEQIMNVVGDEFERERVEVVLTEQHGVKRYRRDNETRYKLTDRGDELAAQLIRHEGLDPQVLLDQAARERYPDAPKAADHVRRLRSLWTYARLHDDPTISAAAYSEAGERMEAMDTSGLSDAEETALEASLRHQAAQDYYEALTGPVGQEMGFYVTRGEAADPMGVEFVAPRGVRWPRVSDVEGRRALFEEEQGPLYGEEVEAPAEEAAPEEATAPSVEEQAAYQWEEEDIEGLSEPEAPPDWEAVAEDLPDRSTRRLPSTVLDDEGLDPMPLTEALDIHRGETPAETVAAAWEDFNSYLPEQLDRLKYPESEEARAAAENEVRAMLTLADAADRLKKGEDVSGLPDIAQQRRTLEKRAQQEHLRRRAERPTPPPPHEPTAHEALRPPSLARPARQLAEPLGPATEQIPSRAALEPYETRRPTPPPQPVSPEALEEVVREGARRSEADRIEADMERGLVGFRERMERHYHRFPGWRRGGVELQDSFKREMMRVLHPLERIATQMSRIVRPLDSQRRSWVTILAAALEPEYIRETGALDLPEGERLEIPPEGQVRMALAATDQPVDDAPRYVADDGTVLVDDLPPRTADLWDRAVRWRDMFHDLYFGTDRYPGLKDMAEELGLEVGYIPGYIPKFGVAGMPEDVVEFVQQQLAPYADEPGVKEFLDALEPTEPPTVPADVLQQAIDQLGLPDEAKEVLAQLEGATLEEVREALAPHVTAETLEEIVGFFRPQITRRATFTGPLSKMAEAAALIERGEEGDVARASRLIMELDAGLALHAYMQQMRMIGQRLAAKRFVEQNFATAEELEASGEGRAQMARAQGGTDELGTIFPEFEGYILPQPVNDVLVQELGWAGLNDILVQKARTGNPVLNLLRSWVRPIKIPLLLTWRFALSANLPEQIDNLVRLGITPSPRRTRLAARVLTEMVLEGYDRAPPATLGERAERGTAALSRWVNDRLTNAWRRLRHLLKNDPEEPLTDEEIDYWLDLFMRYNPAATSMGYQVAQELRGREAISDAIVEYVRRRYGREMHLLTRGAQEAGDLADILVDLVFGMDTIGRAVGFIGLVEQGMTPAEAVRTLDRECANYHPLAHMPVDDALGSAFLFWTYFRQRTQQLARKVIERPFLAPYVARRAEDIPEATGHTQAQQVVLDAKPGWMGPQHVVLPWGALPGITPLPQESPVYEDVGPLVPVVAVRGPTLEHPADLWELLRTPSDEISWRLLPPWHMLVRMERGATTRSLAKDVPLLGKWTRLFAEMPQAQGVTGLVSTRVRARMGLPLTPEEIQEAVREERVPERCRAPERMWEDDPERAAQYEYDYMRLNSQVDALESLWGVNIIVLPVDRFIDNMTPDQLVRVIELQRRGLPSGIPTARFEEELQQRWVRGQGPVTWGEQQRGLVRGFSGAARDLLQPLRTEQEGSR